MPQFSMPDSFFPPVLHADALVTSTLAILLFFIVFQRFLVNGVATQGLKG